jgi:hypothetical protein
MKKIIFGMVIIAAFAITINLGSTKDKVQISDLALRNIEALAQTEIGPAPEGSSAFCAYRISHGGIGIVRACESCVFQFFVGGYAGTSSCYL